MQEQQHYTAITERLISMTLCLHHRSQPQILGLALPLPLRWLLARTVSGQNLCQQIMPDGAPSFLVPGSRRKRDELTSRSSRNHVEGYRGACPSSLGKLPQLSIPWAAPGSPEAYAEPGGRASTAAALPELVVVRRLSFSPLVSSFFLCSNLRNHAK